MIIHLQKSKIFTIDPAVRFAQEYHVAPKLWSELWKRYGLLEYDTDGLCGYFLHKAGYKISARSLRRWLMLTEIYCRAQHVMQMGVRVVDSTYFDKYEQDVLDLLLSNMKFNGKHNSRSVV